MTEQEQEARSALRQMQLIAACFSVSSLLMPIAAWWFQSGVARSQILVVAGLAYGAGFVALVLAVGLAFRARLAESSLHAPDLDGFRWRRLMLVVVPAGFAEGAAVFMAFAWLQSGFDPLFLSLSLPIVAVLWSLWPRAEIEAEAERRFRNNDRRATVQSSTAQR